MQIKRNTPTAQLPIRATEGSAGLDLVCDSVELNPAGSRCIVDTGISIAVPEGHVALLFSRSGQGFKHDVRLVNCVGVIDSDYRGPLKIKLTADSPVGIDYIMKIQRGDRIAQMVLVKLPDITIEEVDELDETVRGEGGMGSTGN